MPYEVVIVYLNVWVNLKGECVNENDPRYTNDSNATETSDGICWLLCGDDHLKVFDDGKSSDEFQVFPQECINVKSRCKCV